MPSVPGTAGTTAASEALPQMEQQGTVNGRAWGSRGKGKDSNLGIKCCCSVTSPEQTVWCPFTLEPRGCPCSGCRRAWLGWMRTRVLLWVVMRVWMGLGASPRYCLVLTSPSSAWGALRGNSQAGAGNALLLLCKAKGSAPFL